MMSEVSRSATLVFPPAHPRQTLVLAPGMACDRSIFARQIAALSDLADIVVVDYGLARSMTDMAEQALSHIPGPISVAGHSMGGRVALEMYRLAPQRVERLCLIGTEYSPRPKGEAGEAETATRNALLDTARTKGMRAMGQAWMGALIAKERQKDTALVEAILGNFERHTPAIVEAQIAAGYDRPDHSQLLPQIRCSVLLIAGREDIMRPARVHESMHELIPASRLILVDRCGHMPTMEQPDIVSAAMYGWLQNYPEQNIVSTACNSRQTT